MPLQGGKHNSGAAGRLRALLRPDRFSGAVGWTLALRLLGLPLQLLLFLLVARLHDVASVGLFAVVTGIWLGLRSLGPLGFDFSAMRFIPAFAADGRQAAVRAFLRLGLYWTQLPTVLAAVLLGAGAARLGDGVQAIAGTGAAPETVAAEPAGFLLCALGLPAFVLIGYLVGVLRARQRVVPAQLLEMVLQPLAGLVLVAAVAVAAPEAGVAGSLAAVAAAAWAVALGYLWLARADLGPSPPLPRAERQEIVRTSLRIGLSSAIVIVTLRAPVIVLFLLAGAAASALYEAAQRFALLGTLGAWTVVAAASPLMAEAFAAGDRGRLRRLLAGSIAVAAAPAAGVVLGLLALGDWLLGWFGAEYQAARWVAVLLALAFLANALGTPAGSAFYMIGRERLALGFNLAGLAVLAVALPAGAWAAGPQGAALAFLLALAVREGGMAVAAVRILGLRAADLDPRRLAAALRAGPAAGERA